LSSITASHLTMPAGWTATANKSVTHLVKSQ
jgi:hypothetical protein